MKLKVHRMRKHTVFRIVAYQSKNWNQIHAKHRWYVFQKVEIFPWFYSTWGIFLPKLSNVSRPCLSRGALTFCTTELLEGHQSIPSRISAFQMLFPVWTLETENLEELVDSDITLAVTYLQNVVCIVKCIWRGQIRNFHRFGEIYRQTEQTWTLSFFKALPRVHYEFALRYFQTSMSASEHCYLYRALG